VIRSKRRRWAGHVALTGAVRNKKKLSEKLKGKDPLKYVGVDWRIILECILNNMV
jgi:hypothetical protein